MNNFELLLQTFNSSPDWIKFVWIISITSLFIVPLGLGAYVFLRSRELSFQMKEQTILGKAALEERKDLLRVVYHQQELLAVPDVDAELYNLPDCPIPVVRSLHSVNGEWPEELRNEDKSHNHPYHNFKLSEPSHNVNERQSEPTSDLKPEPKPATTEANPTP